MKENAQRYLEALNELEWRRIQAGVETLPRQDELQFAARLGRLWEALSESEQEEVELELAKENAAAEAGPTDSLATDTPTEDGRPEPPRTSGPYIAIPPPPGKAKAKTPRAQRRTDAPSSGAPYGWLIDYNTLIAIRPATKFERDATKRSIARGDNGRFRDPTLRKDVLVEKRTPR